MSERRGTIDGIRGLGKRQRDASAMGNLRSPFVGTQVSRVPREEPMMAVKVLGCVLEFAIYGFVRILQDLGTCGLCSFKMLFNILNKHGQALRSRAQLSRGRGACARPRQHDPGVAEMHLRAAERLRGIAITVVFDKAEGFA